MEPAEIFNMLANGIDPSRRVEEELSKMTSEEREDFFWKTLRAKQSSEGQRVPGKKMQQVLKQAHKFAKENNMPPYQPRPLTVEVLSKMYDLNFEEGVSEDLLL